MPFCNAAIRSASSIIHISLMWRETRRPAWRQHSHRACPSGLLMKTSWLMHYTAGQTAKPRAAHHTSSLISWRHLNNMHILYTHARSTCKPNNIISTHIVAQIALIIWQHQAERWPLPSGWPFTYSSPAWSLFLCVERQSFLAIIVLLRHNRVCVCARLAYILSLLYICIRETVIEEVHLSHFKTESDPVS